MTIHYSFTQFTYVGMSLLINSLLMLITLLARSSPNTATTKYCSSVFRQLVIQVCSIESIISILYNVLALNGKTFIFAEIESAITSLCNMT